MKLHPKQVEKLVGNPEKTAAAVDLVYTTEDQLSIHRKKHGRGYVYFQGNQKIKDKKSIERFKALVIPPAWENVRISPFENGHLQVVGKDVKGRTQYRYHPQWNKVRNSTKFFRMLAFGEVLSKMRVQVKQDLKQKKMTKTKCLALVISLMEETHIRIGSEYYAKENKSYGLSTMRDKHVKNTTDGIRFEFSGKKGVKHKVEVHDKKLRNLINQCEEIPGWELFQYYDEDGEHHRIDSGMVNEYIHRISGGDFTAKDFRTWSASKIFLSSILEFDEVEIKKERESNIIEACNISAEELGNTRSVCRNYYIHPALIQNYLEKGKSAFLKKKRASAKTKELDEVERILHYIIENHPFELDIE